MRKWIIVITITAIAFIGAQATAFAEDETEEPELVGISFEPTSPLEFEPLALVHGSYRAEGGGHIEMGMEEEVENKYFHYDCCRFSEGDCLTLKYIIDEDDEEEGDDPDDPNDPDDPDDPDDPGDDPDDPGDDPDPQGEIEEKAYFFDTQTREFVSEEDEQDTIPEGDVNYEHNQSYENEWTADNDNCFVTITYKEFTDRHQVIVRELKEIRYIPLDELEFYEGIGCNPDTGIYAPSGLFRPGDKMTVIVNDEEETEYTYVCQADESGYYLFFCEETGDRIIREDGRTEIKSSTENQKTNPWVPGTYAEHPQNYLPVLFSNAVCNVPVTLYPNPVASIEFIPVTPYKYYENVNGWQEQGVFLYNDPGYRDGDRFLIRYSNGTSKTYVFDGGEMINEANPKDRFKGAAYWDFAEPAWQDQDLYAFPKQSVENPWSAGGNNEIGFTYYGRTCTVPVTVLPCKDVSFTYTPLHKYILSLECGGFDWGDGFTYNVNVNLYPGDELSVTDEDGEVRTYVVSKSDKLVNKNDPEDILNPRAEPDFVGISGHVDMPTWQLGSENFMTFTFHGMETKVPVTIIPATADAKAAYTGMTTLCDRVGPPKNLLLDYEKTVLNAWAAYQNLSVDEQVTFDRSYEYAIQDYYNVMKQLQKNKITPVIKLSATKYTYTGKVRKPTIKVMNGTTVIPEEYYTVTISPTKKPVNVGTYKIKVVLKGKYGGSNSASYIINPAGVSIKSISALNNGFKLKWTKKTGKITGYQIKCCQKKSFASGVRTITVKKASTTLKEVKSLKNKKRYYVKIRTYKTVNNKRYYSGWSKITSITTK